MTAHILYALMTPMLLRITYEDWRERSLYWFWPVLLAPLVLVNRLWVTQDTWASVGTSVLLLSLIVVLCLAYLRMRFGRSIVDTRIGKGDLAVFPVLALALEPVSMLLVFIGSLVIGILGWWIIPMFREKAVPLAGILTSVLWISLTLQYLETGWGISQLSFNLGEGLWN